MSKDDKPLIEIGQTNLHAGFTTAPAGAFVKVQRTERDMKLYAFTDGELSTIGMFDTIVNIVLVIAGAVLGFILSNDAEAKGLMVGVVVLAFCAVVGFWAARSRTSEVNRVKGESRSIGDGE